ncbi:MAG: diguanylate cyclase and metal dependent phosphohydrolase, partial [Firmicutes bacterium]|nr:diguanylate cyclase and metal dependent phosphohydrolase [Bacillota bacterium]
GPGAAAAHPLAVVATALTFMLLNAGLYAIYLHAGAVMPLHTALRTLLDPAGTRAYLIIMTVGVLAGFAFVAGGWVWALLVLGLAYLLQSTLKRYFEAVRQAKSQAQQLEAVLNATEGALIMTDQAGRVQVANRRVGDLFDVDLDDLVGKAEADVPSLQQVKARIAAGAQAGEQVLELDRSPARFVHWYRAELSSQVGDLQGHIEVFTDVTALKQAEQNLRELYDSTIRALTAAIDARDSYTHGHSGRVSAYAVAIARQMDLSPGDCERIRYSGLLHDIGKLGVDDHVLRKTGALSPSERALMMQHPVIGASVLEKAPVLADLIPGVRWHHEWISGGGYPDGLKGPEIPLDARIIGVADAFDAMTSDRPYRSALSRSEALGRIRAGAGEQFDPAVAAALVAVVDAGDLPAGEDAGAPAAAAEAQGPGMILPVHGKELSIFYRLAREDYSALSLDSMLRRYVDTFYETVGPHVYMVYLRNPETGTLERKAAAGMSPYADRGPAQDMQLVEEALATRKPVVAADLQLLDGYRPAAPGSRSEAVIPLTAQGELLGALVVEARMPGIFTRDMLYLLEALGERLSSAIKLLRYHERLLMAATHDSLTGVYNHSYFYDRLTEETKQARRAAGQLSLVLLDMNGLKAVNMVHGHQAGDEALREFGRILKQHARVNHTVARYGGDEFAVIMPGLGRAEADAEAAALAGELNRSFQWGARSIPLPAASWGIASFPADGYRATDLVLAADHAIVREKRGDGGSAPPVRAAGR